MSYKKIKIAVCLYGQPRTALYCAPWIKQWFTVPSGIQVNQYKKNYDMHPEFVSKEPCDVEVDYFLHIKDYNIYINTIGDPEWDGTANSVKLVSDDYINQLINVYKPKKYQVLTVNEENAMTSTGIRNGYGAMFYSLTSAMRLKREYEIETGTLYDYCFTHRYDGIVGPTIDGFKTRLEGPGFPPMSVTTLGDMFRWKWENWRLGPNDVFLGGDNLAMEMLLADTSRIFLSDNFMMCNDDIGGPNIILGRSFGNSNISHFPDQHMHCAIVRHSADLSRPVMESWLYHQDFWLANHKSILL